MLGNRHLLIGDRANHDGECAMKVIILMVILSGCSSIPCSTDSECEGIDPIVDCPIDYDYVADPLDLQECRDD